MIKTSSRLDCTCTLTIPIILAIIATSILILDGPIELAHAVGLGDKTIWQEGSLLGGQYETTDGEPSEVNKLFERPKERELLGQAQADELYERYIDLVKHWPIEVVEARRDLQRLMNVVTTKSQAHFLIEHNNYYKQLKVGTTNRPMLMAYLGLRLSSRENLRAWLDKAVRAGGPAGALIASTCVSLLETRDMHAPPGDTRPADGKVSYILNKLNKSYGNHQAHRFHLAYLTFENNLPLFMLENFLILCSRLDEIVPERVKMSEFTANYKPLF